MIKFDFDTYNETFTECDLESIHSDFLKGDIPNWYRLDEDRDAISKCAQKVRLQADVFIVIGIGGSYLGAQAVINALTPYFHKTKPEIIFAGTDLSSEYLQNLLEYIDDKSVYINVISKSGTTLETLATFSVLFDYMQNKYDDYNERIIVTTNGEDGKLLEMANEYHFPKFLISKDTIGRYSVLTAVGLLPIAVAGIDINALLKGARKAKDNFDDCYKYVKLRDTMYQEGRIVEAFTVYEPKLASFTEWLKQLFAESQGKENGGILPISVINTRDLHSLGQYLQEGIPMIFSTVIFVNDDINLNIKAYDMPMDKINELAFESVAEANYPHTKTNAIIVDELNEENIGYLIFFFEMSAMLGCSLLGVKYDNQPGVNNYKEVLNRQM